jgi:predicted nucleotidyltransferase
MDLRARWQQFDALCQLAKGFEDLEVWAFGSALRDEDPHDLDVLLIYDERASVVAVRTARIWSETDPPCDIIAMTRAEEREYAFIHATGAVRFV